MVFDKKNFLDSFPELDRPEILEELKNSAIKMTFDNEQVILDYDSEVVMIPMVIKGSIKVLQNDESGKEILLYYIKPGESCIMSILASKKNQRSQIRAVASEQTEVIVFPSSLLNNWSDNYKNWNEFVFNLYQTRFEELIHIVNELAFSKVDKRLLELLETKAQMSGNSQLVITHQQIADELGTAREVISRILKKLENDGIVKLMRGKIEIISLSN